MSSLHILCFISSGFHFNQIMLIPFGIYFFLLQCEAKKKDVHNLDDGQLKALLDEAIQYKCPKDREGKSKIFRVSTI